jgi:hypothetical protein
MLNDFHNALWLLLFLVSVGITLYKFLCSNKYKKFSLFTSIVLLINLIIQLKS